MSLAYAVEPVRGYSSVRNKMLAEMRSASDVAGMLMIDDDETARPDWAAVMLGRAAETGAAVLTGPVAYVYDRRPNDPYESFFRTDFEDVDDGGRLDVASGNNVYLQREWFVTEGKDLHFSMKFNEVGGEESDFFRRAHAHGATIQFCRPAWVDSVVTPDRLTMRWAMKRAVQKGRADAIYRLAREGASFPRILVGGLLRVVLGGARIPLDLLRHRHLSGYSINVLGRGVGFVDRRNRLAARVPGQ